MDPTQCYNEMLAALAAADIDTTRNHALSLRAWLDRGGFCPTGHTAEEVRATLADVLRRFPADSLEVDDET